MKKIDCYKLEDIFTPTQPAYYTFVDRKAIDTRLQRALRIPGMQIILYGHSGSGKTTILSMKKKDKIIDAVTTRCMIGMTLNDLMVDAFNQLEVYYNVEKEQVKSTKVEGGLSALYFGIKAKLQASNSTDQKTTSRRAVDLPITPQSLAQFIGASKKCWIIEDFHKIQDKEKKPMSQIMKIFMDYSQDYPSLKIIAVGAVNSAREVTEYDPEMNNRVTEIEVPLMTKNDLSKIISLGERCLNIDIPDKVSEKIMAYSSGLPSVTHNLCYLLCDVNSIHETNTTHKAVVIPSNTFDVALNEYIDEKSDSLASIYDCATKLIYKRKDESPEKILKAILLCKKEFFTINDIKESILIENKYYTGTNLKKYVDELTTPLRAEILRYDKTSNKYYFSSPFVKAFCQCKYKLDVSGVVNLMKIYRAELRRELEVSYEIFLKDFDNVDLVNDDSDVGLYYNY